MYSKEFCFQQHFYGNKKVNLLLFYMINEKILCDLYRNLKKFSMIHDWYLAPYVTLLVGHIDW